MTGVIKQTKIILMSTNNQNRLMELESTIQKENAENNSKAQTEVQIKIKSTER